MKQLTLTEYEFRQEKVAATSRSPSKITRILAHLASGASLNRFEAEPLGDHCLNSTIATLANQYGLNFIRLPERVPNRWGEPCRVTRYSLTKSERALARMVLEKLQREAPGSAGALA
ncbi:hypothetical protein SAMN05216271_3586 [Halopseudomonas sabulinigri]|uniref:Uncharacterized protein n=1 Tax=Halopseudomonas sabulinigri TaxID=472181 RepID=A0A1H1XL74_9GAMM|nr:hypothetical protein SAMN05216271_3586 [Halopseudomonas sabulinigri]